MRTEEADGMEGLGPAAKGSHSCADRELQGMPEIFQATAILEC